MGALSLAILSDGAPLPTPPPAPLPFSFHHPCVALLNLLALQSSRTAWSSFAVLARVSREWHSTVNEWRSLVIEIELSGRISVAAIAAIVADCSHLQTLHLSRREILRDSVAAASHCPAAYELDVAACGLVTSDAVHGIARSCTWLRKLDLGSCSSIDDAAITSLSQHCHQLRSLDVSNCAGLTDEAVYALARHRPEMTELDLHACSLSAAAIESIGGSFPQLRVLHLTTCEETTDEAVRALLQGCQLLEVGPPRPSMTVHGPSRQPPPSPQHAPCTTGARRLRVTFPWPSLTFHDLLCTGTRRLWVHSAHRHRGRAHRRALRRRRRHTRLPTPQRVQRTGRCRPRDALRIGHPPAPSPASPPGASERPRASVPALCQIPSRILSRLLSRTWPLSDPEPHPEPNVASPLPARILSRGARMSPGRRCRRRSRSTSAAAAASRASTSPRRPSPTTSSSPSRAAARSCTRYSSSTARG